MGNSDLGTSYTRPRAAQILSRCCIAFYRGTSLIRNTPLLGPYSRTIPGVLWWSWGGGAVSCERDTPVVDVTVVKSRRSSYTGQCPQNDSNRPDPSGPLGLDLARHR